MNGVPTYAMTPDEPKHIGLALALVTLAVA
jgi:hypothetical protein